MEVGHQCTQGVYPKPRPSFAQFAEPMTAALADLGELARSLTAFAAFQRHFLSTFAARTLNQKRSCSLNYGEAVPRNLARLSRTRLHRLAMNLKLSVLLPFFCQRPSRIWPYQNLSPLLQQRYLYLGFHKTMPRDFPRIHYPAEAAHSRPFTFFVVPLP
jgi:hypothetical protein